MNSIHRPARGRGRAGLRRGLAAAMAVVAVAACSSPAEDSGDEEPSGSGEDATQGRSTEGTTASARLAPVVVTAMYPELGLLAQLGYAEDLGDIGPIFEALADEANAEGGLAGHPIDIEVVTFDLMTEGDSVQACLTATQDLGSFVVVGLPGVFGEAVPCVTDENETLMLGQDGFPGEYYERAEGRLFSLLPSKEAAQTSIVTGLADELAAAPFAVLSSNDTAGDNAAVQDALLPALDAAGLEPVKTIVLDSDPTVAAGQVPVEVDELGDAGVETIVSTVSFTTATPLAQAMEAAGLDVQWLGSDAAGFASDLYAGQVDPNQMDGARAVTVTELGWEEAGLDEPAAEAACRERVGELVDRDIPVGSVDATAATLACNFIDLLVAAGDQLDGEPTTESLSAALQQLTDLELAGYGPAGFGDGDFEAGNAVRTVTWSAGCGCWAAEGDFEPLAAP